MNRKSYIIAFFILTLLSCQTNENKKGKEFKTEKYSITYPSNLKLEEKVDGAEFILSTEKSSEQDSFIESINLVVQDVNISFKDYIPYCEDEIKKAAELISSEVISNNGRETHRIEFTLKQNGIQLSFIQHSLIVDNKLFMLTFSCESEEFDNYKSQMENTMLSFKVD
ncbi:hypothetical protein ABW636_11570 [Aquimarina sp. 2201CG1-2-11]|uniref:PsbP-related protein n=1 Tax=Aquimarina discodermiae TaxID=3231043 RepID=UPI0034632B7A